MFTAQRSRDMWGITAQENLHFWKDLYSERSPKLLLYPFSLGGVGGGAAGHKACWILAPQIRD